VTRKRVRRVFWSLVSNERVMAVLHKTKQAPLRRSFAAPMWRKYEAIINNTYIGPLYKLAASDESGGLRERRAYSEAGDARANLVACLRDAYRLLRACWWGKPGPLQLRESMAARSRWMVFVPPLVLWLINR
jgi:hypothetical protein